MIPDPRIKTHRHIVITIAVMVFIFMQSSFSGEVSSLESGMVAAFLRNLFGDSLTIRTLYLRKAAHFIEFMALGICLLTNCSDWKMLHPDRRLSFPAAAGIAWAAGTLYAVTDELHQLFTPGRSGSIRDVGIDAAGVLFGILICALFRALRSVSRKKRIHSDSE